MDPLIIGYIGLAVFLVFLLAGVPVGFAMGIVGFAGFALIISPAAAFGKIAMIPLHNFTDFNFAVIPAFIFMAQVFDNAGFGANLFEVCEKWMGHKRGGLAIASIVACAIFAAISASSVATVLTVGLVAVPEMLKRRYNPGFAGATVATGGGLGVLIPPSGALILYGIMTEQSIKDLFAAGILPGILLSLIYIVIIAILTRRNPDLAPPGPKYSFRERFQSLRMLVDVLLVIMISIGGLFAGLFTPTEAGAAGASGAMLIALLRRRLSWAGFVKAVKGTITNTGLVGFVLTGAMMFNFFAAASTVPQKLVEVVGEMSTSPYVVIFIITIILLILGMFLDSLAMLLLTVPLLFPLVVSVGIDPIWFGIFIVMTQEMGVITPPVGINVYIAGNMHPKLSSDIIFKKVWPFVVGQLVCIVLLTVFPQIVLYLPNILK